MSNRCNGNPERVRFALRPPTCHHSPLASPFGDFGTCTFPTTPARYARALALGLAKASCDGTPRAALAKPAKRGLPTRLKNANRNLGLGSSTASRPGLDISYGRSYIVVMKRVAAAKFKEQCLSILDHLDADGLVITKHGKPVARLLPAERASAELIGALQGRIHIKGDIQSTGVTWNANG